MSLKRQPRTVAVFCLMSSLSLSQSILCVFLDGQVRQWHLVITRQFSAVDLAYIITDLIVYHCFLCGCFYFACVIFLLDKEFRAKLILSLELITCFWLQMRTSTRAMPATLLSWMLPLSSTQFIWKRNVTLTASQ